MMQACLRRESRPRTADAAPPPSRSPSCVRTVWQQPFRTADQEHMLEFQAFGGVDRGDGHTDSCPQRVTSQRLQHGQTRSARHPRAREFCHPRSPPHAIAQIARSCNALAAESCLLCVDARQNRTSRKEIHPARRPVCAMRAATPCASSVIACRIRSCVTHAWPCSRTRRTQYQIVVPAAGDARPVLDWHSSPPAAWNDNLVFRADIGGQRAELVGEIAADHSCCAPANE